MTATNTQAAPVIKTAEVFFTFKSAKNSTQVSLWLTKQTKETSPDIDGTIGDLRVAGYIHQGSKGGFVSFIDSKAGKDAAGHYKQVATGQVVVAQGRAKLVITMADEAKTKVWAETSKRTSEDLLVSMGLNLGTLNTKRVAKPVKKAAVAA